MRSRRLCSAGIAILAAAFPLRGGAQALRVGDVRPVNGAGEVRPLIEPHLAVHPADPRHLLAAAIVADTATTYQARLRAQRCATFLSTDGGGTWQRHDLPVPGCYDPWVVITPDGHAALAVLSIREHRGTSQTELLVYHSADGGRTWDDEPESLGRGHDHPTLVVDATSAERRGWLYLLSSQDVRADAGRTRFAISVARSRTQGRTFDAPVRLMPSNLNIRAEMPAVLPDGSLLVSYVDAQYNQDGFRSKAGILERRRGWVLRSTDGGATFSLPLFATEACGPPGFRLSAFVVDRSTGPLRGRAYFACLRHGGGAIALSSSPDGGEQWSAPALVHTAPPDTSVLREQPALAVSTRGVLLAAWMDTRGGAGRGCHALYVSASLDGGATFLPEQRVGARVSCPTAERNGAATLSSWPLGGDYFGLVALPDGGFRLLWPAAPNGTYRLYTAVVQVIGQARPRN